MNLALTKHTETIGLIGHVIVDYPSKDAVRKIIKTMVENKVALIELQIPFSECVADGPVFMQANHEAIEKGVHVVDGFALLQEVSTMYPDTKFVLMTYVNILYVYGFSNFVKKAKSSGAFGFIVPDLPVESGTEYLQACAANQLAAIQVIPPNINDTRLKMISDQATGFVYAVARAGVTGKQTDFNTALKRFINRIRTHTDLPIAVGFGVRSKADVLRLKPIADYAIVGTQALLVYQENGLAALNDFWASLASQC